MFGLWTRRRRQPAAMAARRPRLCVEALETRYCLNASLLSLTAQALPGRSVQLTGSLMDVMPSGALIMFSGAATGSTLTDSSGRFSYITQSAGLGQVSAVGQDVMGQVS